MSRTPPWVHDVVVCLYICTILYCTEISLPLAKLFWQLGEFSGSPLALVSHILFVLVWYEAIWQLLLALSAEAKPLNAIDFGKA